MLRFLSLGSGSSGNCYCLLTETGGVIIDAGIGIRTLKKTFFSYGIKPAKIDAVIVTHDHADHIKAVGAVSQEFKLPVYATQAVHQGIADNYCVHKKVPLDLQRNLQYNQTVQIGELSITPFHVPHDSTDCVGFKIEAEGKTFVLMTDVGHVTEEMQQMISEADYLVIEANHDLEMLTSGPYPEYLKQRIAGQNGHLSNSSCATAIAEHMTEKLRHVWLCHLSEENNHPELARKTIETILASYGIVAGADFQLDILKRKMPTGIFEL